MMMTAPNNRLRLRLRRLMLRWGVGGAAVLLLLVSGCESDDDASPPDQPSIAETHDFGDNNPALIVAMGDSITRAINNVRPYPDMLAELMGMTVINEGYSGEHAYEGVARVNGVLERYKPGYLLILYGANDLLHAGYADQIAEYIRSMVLAARASKTIPVVATLTPMARSHGVFDDAVKSINHFIRAMAAEENVQVVDLEIVFDSYDNDENPYIMEADDLLQWDGLHPNEAGNWEIALAFEEVLNFIMTGKAVGLGAR